MTDFETHPVGTADLVKRLRSYQEYEQTRDGQIVCVESEIANEAADNIQQLVATVEQLEATLTRANAATAAAYEVAAKEMEDERAAIAIRAIATPDQTAAMDRLIAEAEARVWDKAADIARQAVEITGHRMREAKEKKNKKEERDWQSMLFCAVDIRTAILAASKKGGA